MTRVLAAGSRVPADAELWEPDGDPALARSAAEAPGCVPWFAVFAGTAVCAPEPERGAGTVPQPTVTAAARHIASPAEMRSILASLRQSEPHGGAVLQLIQNLDASRVETVPQRGDFPGGRAPIWTSIFYASLRLG